MGASGLVILDASIQGTSMDGGPGRLMLTGEGGHRQETEVPVLLEPGVGGSTAVGHLTRSHRPLRMSLTGVTRQGELSPVILGTGW